MKNIFSSFALIVCYCTAFTSPSDSIGVKKMDSNYFVMHKVEQGETLYRLSKKYNTSVDDIKKANNNSIVLSIGQIILIPLDYRPKIDSVSSGSNNYHKVAQGLVFVLQ